MKRVYLFTFMLLSMPVAAVLSGCSEEGNGEGKNEPMSFTAEIGSRVQTRALADTAKTKDYGLTVSATKPAKDITMSVSKMTRVTTADGSWPGNANVAIHVGNNTASYTVNTDGSITSGSPFYWANKNNVYVTSWFPYSASLPSSWSVKSDQSTSNETDYGASDLLYASNTFAYGGGSSNKLQYTHETAKVVINIVKANDVTSASSVKSVTIGATSTPISLSGNVGSNGAITATTASTGSITPYQQSTPSSASDAATYTALVIPQDMNGKQFINVTVGSNTYCYKPTSSTMLQGGYEYDYNITIPSAETYYFSDGTCGKLADNQGKTPIAVVFSNRVSAEEQAKGYHNYAIALNDVSNSTYIWGPYSDCNSYTYANDTKLLNETELSEYYSDLSSGYDATYTDNIFSGGMANNSYPAFQAAKNYSNLVATPPNSSGWYLPSMGQWWDVIANLGKLDLSSYQTNGDNGKEISTTTALNNINSCFKAAGGNGLMTAWYWSSSEYSYNLADRIYFCTSYVYLHFNYKSDYNVYYVRAVIAF